MLSSIHTDAVADREQALLDAAKGGDAPEVSRLLDVGVDPDTRDHLTNTTALGLAA